MSSAVTEDGTPFSATSVLQLQSRALRAIFRKSSLAQFVLISAADPVAEDVAESALVLAGVGVLDGLLRHHDTIAAIDEFLDFFLPARCGQGWVDVSAVGVDDDCGGGIGHGFVTDPVLRESPNDSLGLISVSNPPDVVEADDWSRLVGDAARVLVPGGHLIARSMLREGLESQCDVSFVTEENPVDDASPLCPVVWIGRKR